MTPCVIHTNDPLCDPPLMTPCSVHTFDPCLVPTFDPLFGTYF